MTTVNVSHIGSEAEVQLAEALVAVSESMIGPDDGMETAHVVAVETTGQESDEQVCAWCHDLEIEYNGAQLFSTYFLRPWENKGYRTQYDVIAFSIRCLMSTCQAPSMP